jgi:hypothetical protein
MYLLTFLARGPGRSSHGASTGKRHLARGPGIRVWGAVAVVGVMTMLGSSAASAGSGPRPLTPPAAKTRAQWQTGIAHARRPGTGCYRAFYPVVAWRATACVRARRIPLRGEQQPAGLPGVAAVRVRLRRMHLF